MVSYLDFQAKAMTYDKAKVHCNETVSPCRGGGTLGLA